MILLLIAAGVVYLLLGDVHEAIGLMAAIFFVIAISLVKSVAASERSRRCATFRVRARW